MKAKMMRAISNNAPSAAPIPMPAFAPVDKPVDSRDAERVVVADEVGNAVVGDGERVLEEVLGDEALEDLDEVDEEDVPV